jgi:hypothetical protein
VEVQRRVKLIALRKALFHLQGGYVHFWLYMVLRIALKLGAAFRRRNGRCGPVPGLWEVATYISNRRVPATADLAGTFIEGNNQGPNVAS